MEEEQSINVLNVRLINQVRIQTPCTPSVTYIHDDMAIHDFDIVMVNFSIGLYQYLVVDRIIGNIRVSMTKKLYTTIKNESHHLVTQELLARKWVIGLKNSKETLKATTQECIFRPYYP